MLIDVICIDTAENCGIYTHDDSAHLANYCTCIFTLTCDSLKPVFHHISSICYFDGLCACVLCVYTTTDKYIRSYSPIYIYPLTSCCDNSLNPNASRVVVIVISRGSVYWSVSVRAPNRVPSTHPLYPPSPPFPIPGWYRRHLNIWRSERVLKQDREKLEKTRNRTPWIRRLHLENGEVKGQLKQRLLSLLPWVTQ